MIDRNKQIGGMMRNGRTEATVIKSLHGSKWLPSLDLWAEWSIKNKAVWNATFQYIWKHCGNIDSFIQMLTLWRMVIFMLNLIKQNVLKYLSVLVLLYCKVNVLLLRSKMLPKHPFGSECSFLTTTMLSSIDWCCCSAVLKEQKNLKQIETPWIN